jgi:hypothetical protein
MRQWNNLDELCEWESRIIDKKVRDKEFHLKPFILCFGISDSPLVRELAQIVNPAREKRTSNVGIPLRLNNNSIVNAPTAVLYDSNEDFTFASPFKLRGQPNNILIYFKDKIFGKAELINHGDWLNKETLNGKKYSSIILPEADKFLMAAIPAPCCYQVAGKACLFCEYDVSTLDKKVEDFIEVAVSAFKNNPSYSLTLTGGNTRTKDRGLKRFIPYVEAISKNVTKAIGRKPAIQLEVSPPNSEKYFDELIEAGATSFMMNLEQGDQKYRNIVCPEKSKIPLSDYIKAFEYLVKEKGVGAASVLINGLIESSKSTLKYAKMLSELGVRPIILPFRPRGKLKRYYPADPSEFEYVSREVAKLTVDTSKTEGCANCPGCAMLPHEIYEPSFAK